MAQMLPTYVDVFTTHLPGTTLMLDRFHLIRLCTANHLRLSWMRRSSSRMDIRSSESVFPALDGSLIHNS